MILEDAEYATALEGWVEYGKYLSPGVHVAGNVIGGDNPASFVAEDGDLEFQRFLGLQGWAEYLIRTGSDLLDAVGLVLRADRFDPDTDADEDANVLVTPGLNVYHSTVFKAQANYDVSIPQSDELDTESAFRLQIKLLF